MAILAQTWPDLERGFAGAQEFLQQHPWVFFVLLFLLTWLIARLLSQYVLQRFLRSRRVELAIVQLISRLFVLIVLITALIVYSNVLFKTNVAALVTTLGLVSLALGFGLQNAIANVAGGISLAADRPFRIGDYIQVGDIQGDVQQIGIRSTRILTQRKEYIVIPNKRLEEQPIINYTLLFPEIRLDVPVGISYDSDWRLAEEIMIEVAQAHPVVLRRPPPRVLLHKFGASSMDLELRCWISHPRNRHIVQSDLLKAIKDRFDQEGVELPFPYQTNVEKRDLPTPKKRSRPATRAGSMQAQRRLLIPFTGPLPPKERLVYAVSLAKALRAQVMAAYVDLHGREEHTDEATRALSMFEREAESRGIWVKPILRFTRDFGTAVVDLAEEEDVDAVVLGIDHDRGLFRVEWGTRQDLASTLKEPLLRRLGLKAPYHLMSPDLRVTPKLVAALEAKIGEHRKRATPAAVPAVPVSPPDPTTSSVPSPPAEGPAATKEPKADGAVKTPPAP